MATRMAIRPRPPRGLAVDGVAPVIVRALPRWPGVRPVTIATALRAWGPAAAAGLVGGLLWWLLALLTPLEPVGARPWAAAAAFGVVVVAASTVGALAARSVAARQIAARQEALRVRVASLQQAQQQWTEAEERLRRDIAELLHGRVQTRLLVTWHRLSQCEQLVNREPAEAIALLREVRDQIDQIREQDVRQASHRLHPSIIQVGLVPALRSLIAEFDGQLQIAFHSDARLEALDDPVANRIPEPVRLVAYRVVEEALGNAYRHGEAGSVDITLELDRDRGLGILVRDDGHGFDPTRLTPGLGLGSIAARVDQVGGTWDISSAVSRGTTLTAYLPLVVQPAGSGWAPGRAKPKQDVSAHRRTPRAVGPAPHAPLLATLPLYQRGQPQPPAPEVMVHDPWGGM